MMTPCRYVILTLLWFILSLGATMAQSECRLRASSKVVDLSGQASIHIDQAPFVAPAHILDQDYIQINQLKAIDHDFNTQNTVGWIGFQLCVSNDDPPIDGYLFFGDFDRIMVYKKINGALQLSNKMGDLYKNQIVPHSPDRMLYPLDINSGEEISLYVYLAQSFPNRFDLDKLDLKYIPKPEKDHFLNYSNFRILGGFIHVGLIFLISFLISVCILFLFLYKDYRLLGFAFICFAALLYYMRDMEVYYEPAILWSHIDEGPLRVEALLRGLIAASFIVFVLSNFTFGKWRRTVYITSALAVSLSLINGLWRYFTIGPFQVASILDQGVHLGDIIITLINSLFLLGLLWKDNEPFARSFVLGILTFIFFSYCGLLLNTTSLGELDSLLSSKLYSTYGMIIFLFYIAIFSFKRSYNTQRDYIIQSAKAEHLQELSKVKTRLYTNISHEFRTPLTVILGTLESISGTPREKSIIERNSRQLLDLVNQMLLLSKADAGSLNLQLINGDIISYLNYITESFLSLAEKKNIRLLLYSDDTEIKMDYDEDVIKKIISNLLSNAIKFTPRGGKIVIILSKKGNSLNWKIKDSGIGIPPDEIEKVFDRFYQTEAATRTTLEGTGVGLSIVQEFVHLCDGQIKVESIEGQGTTFIIDLPISNNVPTSINDQNTFSSPLPPISQSNASILPSYKTDDTIILVVEDNLDVREFICRNIPFDYQVIEATNGQEGIKKAIEILPDIIISDVMMPIKDGYELTQTLKEDDRTSHIPIILLTAKATDDEKIEGLNYGADAYLIKPFNKAELLVRIDKLISLRRQLQLRYKSEIESERKSLPEWLLKFESILSDHISDDISMDWLSQQLYMSRTQLHRKISSLVGMSTAQYVKEYRLRKAKQLLQSTNDTVGTIAYNVGYKNAGHFATDFKSRFGSSPSKERTGH